MAKYHVSEDGVARRCEAKSPESCRAQRAEGLEGHYGSAAEARNAYEAKNNYLAFFTAARKNEPRLTPRERMERARDPERMRLAEEKRKAHEEEERTRYREQYEVDAQLSWGELQEHQQSIHVYRAGVPKILSAQERGVESEHYAAADAVKPEGRTGRLDGFCAAPSLGGVARWVRANESRSRSTQSDYAPHKLKVDLDSTYVYNIRAWEMASSEDLQSRERSGEAIAPKERSPYEDYWSTGMSLREFIAKAKEDADEYNPTKWEILLAPDEIQGKPQKVSYERVSEAVYATSESQRREILEIGKRAKKESRILRESAQRLTESSQ